MFAHFTAVIRVKVYKVKVYPSFRIPSLRGVRNLFSISFPASMDQPVTNPTMNDEEDRARYERLLGLYTALEKELAELEAQGKLLRHRGQAILDKQKLFEVLHDIKHNIR